MSPQISTQPVEQQDTTVNTDSKALVKDNALELAQLLYSIYKETQQSARVVSRQNNENMS